MISSVADIVQCGHGDCKALRIDSLDGWRTHAKVQVVDFIGLTGLARRTGRFPQLVDPRSSVNGLLLTGSPRFREVSLDCRRRRLIGSELGSRRVAVTTFRRLLAAVLLVAGLRLLLLL